MRIQKLLQSIISKAADLGLPDDCLNEAREFLDYNEYGLSLDTILEHVYERELTIDDAFFEAIAEAGEKMHIAVERFNHLRSLLK